jgi:purine-nucleoside phosphorylase
MSDQIEETASIVRDHAGDEPIETAVVLGTGLGATLENLLEQAVVLPYADLPAFPKLGVSGHEGKLAVGLLEGERVAVLSGRAHYYENGDLRAMEGAFEALAMLGARVLILTSSVGSCNADLAPGTLALVTDHINATGLNPLAHQGGEGALIPMTEAYDPRLLKRMRRASAGGGVSVREGVYMWFPGPSFETPAEIRMARLLGADFVGMSLPPEVILARRLALRVCAVSIVTNFGAGFHGGDPTHSQTKEVAQQGSIAIRRLLRAFIKARDENWGAKGRETR